MKRIDKLDPGESLAVRIATELKRASLEGNYGLERFPFARTLPTAHTLREKLGPVTLQPVRTALAMLVGEGLLVSTPNRREGFQVHRKRRGLIGLVSRSATGDFIGRVIDGINEELARGSTGTDGACCRLLCVSAWPKAGVFDPDTITQAEDHLISRLAQETDGLIILPAGRIDRMRSFQGLCAAKFPMVLLGPGYQPKDFDPVAGTHQVVYPEKQVARKVASFVEEIVSRDRLFDKGLVAIAGEISNATLFRRAYEIQLCLKDLLPAPCMPLSPKSNGDGG
jgi:hypothetical protein